MLQPSFTAYSLPMALTQRTTKIFNCQAENSIEPGSAGRYLEEHSNHLHTESGNLNRYLCSEVKVRESTLSRDGHFR